jgi:peptidoglycan/LPS O-acetylase OafA/YrhL
VAPAAKRPRLDALSGLRFCAIAFIVCYHVGDVSFADAPALVETARRRANVIMPLFFVLSGFVLTYSYLVPLASGELTKRAFYLSRLWRLVPIYLVALGLQFSIDAYVHRGVPLHYAAGTLAQALMVQGWTPPLVWYGNPPGWTVSVEAFFYLLFPWLVVRLSRMSFRACLAIAGLSWVLGQLVSLAYALTLPDGWPPAGQPAPYFLDLLRYLPPLHLPSFIAGIVAALAFGRDLQADRRPSGRLLALIGFIPIAATLAGGLEALGRHGVRPFGWAFPFTHNGFLSPAWALVVYGLAHAGRRAKVLSARPLVRLGEASYGLYILHFPIYNAVATWLAPDWDHARWFLLQFFALLLPLSVVSFERFEQPLRAALLAYSSRASFSRHSAATSGVPPAQP